MRYGSVCSGIEAPAIAWSALGWEPQWFAEIDPWPKRILAHHHPDVPDLGDFTNVDWSEHAGTADVVVAGTPCQAFSVAGLRQGLDDPRGNLTLAFLGVLEQVRPKWVVWENVPGVLSQDKGRAFGAFLGGLVELGYGWAYRVLDAQYFGLAQRRARVFVVGHLGAWAPAAAVLFERESLRGDPAPSREAGPEIAGTLEARAGTGGARDNDDDAGHLQIADPICANEQRTYTHEDNTFRLRNVVEHPAGFDLHGTPAAEVASETDVHTPLRARPPGGVENSTRTVVMHPPIAGVLEAYGGNDTRGPIDVATACRAKGGSGHGDFESETFVVFDLTQITHPENRSNPEPGDPAPTLAKGAHPPTVAAAGRVRRLTPRECERLQGFPDDFTFITHNGKPIADGPRYRALGNSMAVPVVRWIGRRLQAAQEILDERE